MRCRHALFTMVDTAVALELTRACCQGGGCYQEDALMNESGLCHIPLQPASCAIRQYMTPVVCNDTIVGQTPFVYYTLLGEQKSLTSQVSR